jgi:excisionase family DNA binding protein
MPTLRELEMWMSTGQVAKRLGWSRQGVLNLAADHRIRSVETVIGWLFDPADVERFAREHRAKDHPEREER